MVGTPPSCFPTRRCPPPAPSLWPSLAHLIFTCLIKHSLSSTLLASLPPKLKKCKHRCLQGRSINHPGLAGTLLCPCHLWLGGRGQALPGFNHMLLCLGSAWLLTPEVSRELGDRGCLNKALSLGTSAKRAGSGAVNHCRVSWSTKISKWVSPSPERGRALPEATQQPDQSNSPVTQEMATSKTKIITTIIIIITIITTTDHPGALAKPPHDAIT